MTSFTCYGWSVCSELAGGRYLPGHFPFLFVFVGIDPLDGASTPFSRHSGSSSKWVTWRSCWAGFVMGGQQARDGDGWGLTVGLCGHYWPSRQREGERPVVGTLVVVGGKKQATWESLPGCFQIWAGPGRRPRGWDIFI